MKIIFAQGNPGDQYARTRHNVGFQVLDALAQAKNSPWKQHAKFKALTAEFQESDEKVLLVKPLSYYNETGSVARAIIDFYKLHPETDFLAIHDDLALPFGTIRIREKGSDAGNNGIRSLNAHLGPHYWRIRIGIWNDLRNQIDDADFVLSAFTKAEAERLPKIINDTVLPLCTRFLEGSLESSSHNL